jgi:hypothetical protein
VSKSLRIQYFEKLSEVGQSHTKKRSLANFKERLLLSETPARKLYKYCNIENATKVLSNLNILLQTPDTFNDPFDCLAGVAIWDKETRFSPTASEIEFIKEELNKLPIKYRPNEFRLLHDLRTSYSFVLSCFSAAPKHHLMWSHYANSHRGICFEYNAEDLLNDIHPCIYTDDLSPFNWSKNSKGLALVKNIAWEYEKEWRTVIASSRPKMRLLAQVLHEIYNQIHADPKFSHQDQVEWSSINTNIWKNLEKLFAEERTLQIRPNRVILGARFSRNFSNENNLETCKSIVKSARKFDIPIWLSRTNRNNFHLSEEEITEENPTSLDFNPDLRASFPSNVTAEKWF